MQLIEIKVDHFRNIIDSSAVALESDITCLVGKNESGKTAFLHALYRLYPARANVSFSVPDQYPAWLEKRDRLKGEILEKVKPISVKFLINENEKKKIEEIFGQNILSTDEIILEKDYSGTLSKSLSVNEKALVKHLLANIVLPQKISSEIRKSSTVSEVLTYIERASSRENVSGDTKEILKSIETNIKNIIKENDVESSIWSELKEFLPVLFYFDKYSTLPYSIDIQKLLNSSDEELNDDEMTARSLLRLAAADDDYLMNPDYERRKRELENVANSLTEDVLKYWSQNPNLRVLPDISQKTVSNPQGQQSVLDEIKFRIWDERHLLSLPFCEHSSGFQWFFSFLAAFSEFEYTDTPVIILLDEPALGLHAKAQKDFLRFIEERLAPRCQVIYTTHSPFMVDPSKLERVRIIEDKGREEGMKVTSDVLTTDPDTLFPLQGALGYDMAQHLFIAPHNLVVEGTSDFTYLTVISDFFRSQTERTALDECWSIVPVGGADLIPTFVALLGNHLEVTVLVDAQKAGHQRLSKLAAQGYLAKKRIITVGDILGKKLADIEDLFSINDYLNLYNNTFSDEIKESDLNGTDPVVSRIARFKNIDRFDHGVPADIFLRERDKILPTLSEESLDNFEKLFERLNLTLQ